MLSDIPKKKWPVGCKKTSKINGNCKRNVQNGILTYICPQVCDNENYITSGCQYDNDCSNITTECKTSIL